MSYRLLLQSTDVKSTVYRNIMYAYLLYYVGVELYFHGHIGRGVSGVGLGRLDSGIVGSNPAQGMNLLIFLCCEVLFVIRRKALTLAVRMTFCWCHMTLCKM